MQAGWSDIVLYPLKIDNSKGCPLEAETMLIVYNCPICVLHYNCNNTTVAKSSCTYHQSCLSTFVYGSTDGNVYCASACYTHPFQAFSEEWIDNSSGTPLSAQMEVLPLSNEPIHSTQSKTKSMQASPSING